MPPGKVEKGMRKGTKSCLECRKRKVKCIFNGEDVEKCVTCRAKGTTCVEQRKGAVQVAATISTKTTLEERVAQLETLIRSQNSGDVPFPSPRTHTSTQGSQDSPEVEPSQRDAAQVLYSLGTPTSSYRELLSTNTDTHQIIDPVGSIFNNVLLRQKDSERRTDTGRSESNDFGTIDLELLASPSRVCDELCKDLPSPRLIAAILKCTCSWWDSWRMVGSWLRDSMVQENVRSLQEFVSWTLASSEPQIAALGILCLAISIQQLDYEAHQDIIRQLSRPPGKLFHDYFERVNRLIINHTCYASSRAGIEVIMMSANALMNLGLLKMTWLLHHRGISHAQLLGLHRPHRIYPDETPLQMASRQETWFTLCQNDLYTSLLLGLPYGADGRMISSAVHGTPGTLRFFFYQLTRLSARIVDRNQMGFGTSVSETQEIERDLDAAANELPPDFWDAPAALHRGTIDQVEYRERLGSQFWFSQMKVLLHQPLMVQSLEDPQLLHNRKECLRACRETLIIYHLMRSDASPAFGMVKVVDYQAFICSAILLLGLLGYGIVDPVPLSEAVDQDNDYEKVQTALEVLRKHSMTAYNTIASQAVKGLETLVSLVKAGKTGVCPTPQPDCAGYAAIAIPGSGIISIAPGKILMNALPPSLRNANVLPPPVFHLSHGISTGMPNKQQSHSASQQYPETYPSINPAADFTIPTMDFDWTNMIDMDLGDDWAWLADVNAGVF